MLVGKRLSLSFRMGLDEGRGGQFGPLASTKMRYIQSTREAQEGIHPVS